MDLLLALMILGMVSSTLGTRLDNLNREAPFNVIDFGAVGDGKNDDSQAFMEAWKKVCGARIENPGLIIPRGYRFLLGPITFEGPCIPSRIYVQIFGHIIAPKDKSAWQGHDLKYWLIFSRIDGLTIHGNGQINGQGSNWWHKASEPELSDYMDQLGDRPDALHFFLCNNLRLDGLNHVNSPSKHVSLYACNCSIISNLHIHAPQTSPNTDGIVIGQSSHVQVHDCTIATGDDCVAVCGNSSNVNITRVACGPGHGISIGSLGGGGATHHIEDIHVSDCSFEGTSNGVRIKTWQGGFGYARKISFEGITLINADRPVIIDQFYRPAHNCPNKTWAFEVSDVWYTGIQGTSMREEAISFMCSQMISCSNIVLDRINITMEVATKKTYASCFNARGRSSRSIPKVDCLLK